MMALVVGYAIAAWLGRTVEAAPAVPNRWPTCLFSFVATWGYASLPMSLDSYVLQCYVRQQLKPR